MKIAVYMITKNEDGLLRRAIQSSQDADIILVGDTGNSNDTALVCHQENATYHSITISPWRFDDARNAVLALLPSDVDVCVSLDSDEVLAEGWREEIEKHWKVGETTMMRYMYDWNSGVVFHQAKIHARSGYRWVSPCHETLTRYASGPDVWAYTEKFMMYHYPDNTKSRRSYLPLLVMAYKEAPHIPRNVLYLGREMFFNSLYFPKEQRFKEWGTKLLNQFIGMKNNYPAETSYAYRIIGKMNGDEEAFKKAIDTMPKDTPHRCPRIWYAAWLYSQYRFEECGKQILKALYVTDRTTDYMVDPHSWDGYPHHLMGWALWHQGKKEEAIEWTKRSIELEPEATFYKESLERITKEDPPKSGAVVEERVYTPDQTTQAPSV